MLIFRQPRFGDIPGLGQTAIQTTDPVAFALDVDIARRVFDALGADVKNTEIQRGQNVGFRKVGTRVPSRRRSGVQGDDIAPDQACLFFDLLGIVAEGIHGAAPVGLATRRIFIVLESA